MLAEESLDIVSVATYAPFHADITVACARQGVRAVYCEKPVATRASDAERMCSACDDAGTLLVVNHNRRFQANARRLRDLVVDGALGELTSATLQWGLGTSWQRGYAFHRYDPDVDGSGRRGSLGHAGSGREAGLPRRKSSATLADGACCVSSVG